MPIRFERWMRSKLTASTARTPSRRQALGRPVARRAGAVALAGDEDDGRALVAVALGGAPQRQELAGAGTWIVAARAAPPDRAGCARPGW